MTRLTIRIFLLSVVFATIGETIRVNSAMAQPGQVAVSGFLTTTYNQSNIDAYYAGDNHTGGINKYGSFSGTLFGLNLSSEVTDGVSIASQFLATAEGSESRDHFAVILDWAFVSSVLTRGLSIRGGKIKFPVGLVNEYVDVGTAYPWIRPPLLVYSELGTGPQATRESFVGGSLVFNHFVGDIEIGADVFGGQVDLEEMHIKKLYGMRMSADWQDQVLFNASAYTGRMIAEDPTSPMGMMMNDRDHSAVAVGMMIDWSNVVLYTEYTAVDMDITVQGMSQMMTIDPMDGESYYYTVGYRLGRWLPHVTQQHWHRENGLAHDIDTAGLTYQLSLASVLKIEYSGIETELGSMMMIPVSGLFDSPPTEDPVKMFSVSYSVMF
ncbi:MAG: hypothetical protein ACI9UK_000541 [Candidatus Krumholzibacteriia bacterium]|jgi:hypothetical protein